MVAVGFVGGGGGGGGGALYAIEAEKLGNEDVSNLIEAIVNKK